MLITKPFFELLQSMNVFNSNPEYYIFAKDSLPGCDRFTGRNTFNQQHAQILKKLDLHGFSIYSWKDTGAVDLYNATLDIEFVSRQLRHHSLDMTKIYLRNRGANIDNFEIKNAPNLIY